MVKANSYIINDGEYVQRGDKYINPGRVEIIEKNVLSGNPLYIVRMASGFIFTTDYTGVLNITDAVKANEYA